MGQNPGQQLLVIHAAIRYGQTHMDDVSICAVQVNAVDLQKDQHDEYADALVSVQKGVVGDQVEADPGAFFLNGGVEFLSKSVWMIMVTLSPWNSLPIPS